MLFYNYLQILNNQNSTIWYSFPKFQGFDEACI